MNKVIEPLTNEQLEEWAQALESGEYAQAQGELCDGEAYCCLGVLAKMRGELDANGNFKRPRQRHDGLLVNEYADRWYYLNEGVQTVLTRENDNGATFNKIAKIIRSELIEGDQS